MPSIDTTATDRSPSPNESDKALPTIVVATDGSKASSSAFTSATLISEIADVEVRVVSVLEPLQMPPTVPHDLLDVEEMSSLRVKELASRVSAQMEEHKPAARAWPLETRIGIPAAEIAASAREHGDGLVIVGAHRHRLLERLIGEETAARIVQLGDVSLLIASSAMQRMPRRVAIALDLDPSQLGDLPPVLSLFGPASSVVCVHVQPHEDFPGSDSPSFARAYESAVAESFAVTEAAISKVPGMRADLIRLRGDPATELLHYGEYAKVELLVLGLRRHYGLRRLLGGGVVLKVLRSANCSVLIVPEGAGAKAGIAAGGEAARGTTHTFFDPAMWPSDHRRRL